MDRRTMSQACAMPCRIHMSRNATQSTGAADSIASFVRIILDKGIKARASVDKNNRSA